MLVEVARAVKAHLAETLLSVIIQNRLSDTSAIALFSVVLRAVPLKVSTGQTYLTVLILELLAVDCESLPPKYRSTPAFFQSLHYCGS